MKEDERIWAVKALLFEYVKSPSLRHIRDPHFVTKLAQDIVKRIDREKSAVGCWIPIEDLRQFLNQMPGPRLTTTDVAQRLRVLEDEGHHEYPREEFQAGCLALYDKEKVEGTELPAIIGLLRDHVEHEEEQPHRVAGDASTDAR
jgi:hypothetical protein